MFEKFNKLGDARLELILNHKIAKPILFVFKRFPKLEEINEAFLKAWNANHQAAADYTNKREGDTKNDTANIKLIDTFRIAVMYWKYAEHNTRFTNKAFAAHMTKYCETLPQDDTLKY